MDASCQQPETLVGHVDELCGPDLRGCADVLCGPDEGHMDPSCSPMCPIEDTAPSPDEGHMDPSCAPMCPTEDTAPSPPSGAPDLPPDCLEQYGGPCQDPAMQSEGRALPKQSAVLQEGPVETQEMTVQQKVEQLLI